MMPPARDVLRLPAGRSGGWTGAGLVAVMIFLAILAAAVGLGAAGIVRLSDGRQGGRMTVQVAEADAPRTLAMLATLPGVARATPVDRAALRRLLRPWLGDDPAAAGLPVPAMIDVDLHDPAAAADVERRLRAGDAAIRIDHPARWPAPVSDPMRLTMRIAAALVAMFVLAAVATGALTVRGELAAHRDMVGVMHMLGATDGQLAGLFRRRAAVDAAIGAAAGGAAAFAAIALASDRLMASGTGATLRPVDWAALVAIPPATIALAMLAAHLAAVRALGRMT